MRNYMPPPVPDSIWQNPLHFIAFGFGSGALPRAPGTWGTLFAIPFYLALRDFNYFIYFLIITLIILASIWICDRVEKEMHVHDHQGMCLDEIVGYLVTMFAAPHGIKWIVIGFLLFRLFDIWKPYPIRTIDEKLSGGAGVILDDVLAGIYSCIIIHLLSWIF